MKLFIPTLYQYIRIQRIIKKVAKTENLQQNLSNLFGAQFEKDWVGRYWVVLNPHIQNMNDEIGSNSDSPTTVFQYNKDGSMTNDVAIEKWIMDKLLVAREFMHNNNLFEVMSYDIQQIDSDHNYLFIMQNVLFEDLVHVLKRLLMVGAGLGLILIGLILFI